MCMANYTMGRKSLKKKQAIVIHSWSKVHWELKIGKVTRITEKIVGAITTVEKLENYLDVEVTAIESIEIEVYWLIN